MVLPLNKDVLVLLFLRLFIAVLLFIRSLLVDAEDDNEDIFRWCWFCCAGVKGSPPFLVILMCGAVDAVE